MYVLLFTLMVFTPGYKVNVNSPKSFSVVATPVVVLDWAVCPSADKVKVRSALYPPAFIVNVPTASLANVITNDAEVFILIYAFMWLPLPSYCPPVRTILAMPVPECIVHGVVKATLSPLAAGFPNGFM